ncbi:MAG TPA: chemotaxis protein CheW [Kofleriaceae bacterium]|nr:chemotaxis protein CheW [Kofleriaceae bacterium]
MRICTFRLGPRLLGIDAAQVREIVLLKELTRVAGAPPSVRGLLNLRGAIVTCLELGAILGLPPASAAVPRALVLEGGDEAVSLAVDRVADVLEVEPADVEPVPPTVPRAVAPYLAGTCHRAGQLLLLLDVARVIAAGDPGPP